MLPFVLLLLFDGSTLLRQTFETGDPGWLTVGKSATVRITHDSADVKNGSGALAFDYTVGEGVAIAALPLKDVDTARIDRVRFWMKTDVPTPLAVVLNEKKPGGNYSAVCWSVGNTWQLVELSPSDFHLNQGPNDPVDPDGKLDLDAVENLALLDLSTIVGVKTDPNAPFVSESHAGKHAFFVDDFELWTGSATVARSKSALDDFSTPQLQWLTLGGSELKPEHAGMRATYGQMGDQVVVLLRHLGKVDLREDTKLAFDVASDQPAALVMTFECNAPGKAQGPRYNAQVDIEGGGKVNHREVVLSAFEAGPETDGPVKLDQLKSFSIIDITGQGSGATRKNSLWIGNIRGVGETASRR